MHITLLVPTHHFVLFNRAVVMYVFAVNMMPSKNVKHEFADSKFQRRDHLTVFDEQPSRTAKKDTKPIFYTLTHSYTHVKVIRIRLSHFIIIYLCIAQSLAVEIVTHKYEQAKATMRRNQ